MKVLSGLKKGLLGYAMGFISFIYRVRPRSTKIQKLLNEIENGVVFSRFYKKEKATLVKGKTFTDYSFVDDSKLIIHISDNFFSEETLFCKIWNSFVLNICEYKGVRLESIDFNQSSWAVPKYTQDHSLFTVDGNQFLCGTIIKPYYSMNVDQKIDWMQRFFDLGFNIFKEDETYCVDTNTLLHEVAVINQHFKGKIIYIPNVTHLVTNPTAINDIFDLGSRICLINFLTVGFQNVSYISKKNRGLLWGHRIGYSNFESIITMDALSTLAVLCGLTFLHIGTPKTQSEIVHKMEMVNKLLTISPTFFPVFTKLTRELYKDISAMFGGKAVYLGCGYFYNRFGELDWHRVEDFVRMTNDG